MAFKTEVDWGTSVRLMDRIEDLKRLRRIYEFIKDFGNLNIEYDGEFRRLGDTVMIRPKPILFDGPHTTRPLCINIELPSVGRMERILNIIDWESDGDLVIVTDERGNFYMGYNKL